MSRAFGWLGFGLCILIGVGALRMVRAAVPVAAQQQPQQATAEWGLAWRIDGVSNETLAPDQPDAAWRRSAALLDAAARLQPREPRFLRLRTMALLHVGDTDGAINALKAYRALVPSDTIAQSQMIDLYVGRLETADAKIAYLKGLLNLQNVPPEVRAQAAVRCAGLLAQQSPEQAAEMARRAVQLYPLPDAARLQYELSARKGDLKERVAALLTILRANPNERVIDADHPDERNGIPYVAELADALAGAGLAPESLEWYDTAVKLLTNGGPTRPARFHDLLIDYAAEMMIAADKSGGGTNAAALQRAADTFLGQMLDEQPADADAWFLKLTLGQESGEQVTQEQAQELARNALVRRWNAVATEILTGRPAAAAGTQPTTSAGAGATPNDASAPAAAAAAATSGPAATAPAASQPATVEPIDPQQVLAKLKASPDDPRLRQSFEVAAGDLAWLDVYYRRDVPAATKWIDALRTLIGADAPIIQRLEGWLQLAGEHPQAARDALAKVADRDALAALGLIRAQQAEQKPIDAQAAAKLLAENRVGLIAAMIWQSLRGAVAPPASQPAWNDALAQVRQFPREWFQVLDPHTSRRVYALHAVPAQAGVEFGDPMLARVSIENVSPFDLSIVPGGIVRPDLWFNAQTLGLDDQTFRGVAFDQVANQIVVRARTTTTQLVRVDGGPLRRWLLQSPGAQTRVSTEVIINPTAGPEGIVTAGLGGQGAAFTRTFVYGGVPITQPAGRKVLDNAIGSNDPLDRMRAIDLMSSYIAVASKPDADDSLKKAVAEFPATLNRLRSDPSAPVAAWAGYQAALLNVPAEQERIVTDMAGSKDWTSRLLALFAGRTLSPARQRELAAGLAQNDPDPTVKAAAAATVDLLEHAATQPAASQPADVAGQPAPPAGAPTTAPSGPARF